MLNVSSNNPQNTYNQAVQLFRAGNFPAAQNLFLQILATNPNHADSLNFLGAIAINFNNFPAAIEILRRAIQNNPNLAQAHDHLGIALAQTGNYDEAIASFQRAIALAPG